MSTFWTGVTQLVLMISSYVTASMLVNCCHCFQASDNILLCRSPGLSVPVDLCLCSITCPSVLPVFSIACLFLILLFILSVSSASFSICVSVSAPDSHPSLLGTFHSATFKPHLVRIAL